MNEAVTPRGWQAQLDLHYGLRGNKTHLIDKQQRGPLTLQRSFYPEGDICHNYILHPPGGVVGGDSLQINVNTGLGTLVVRVLWHEFAAEGFWLVGHAS